MRARTTPCYFLARRFLIPPSLPTRDTRRNMRAFHACPVVPGYLILRIGDGIWLWVVLDTRPWTFLILGNDQMRTTRNSPKLSLTSINWSSPKPHVIAVRLDRTQGNLPYRDRSVYRLQEEQRGGLSSSTTAYASHDDTIQAV